MLITLKASSSVRSSPIQIGNTLSELAYPVNTKNKTLSQDIYVAHETRTITNTTLIYFFYKKKKRRLFIYKAIKLTLMELPTCSKMANTLTPSCSTSHSSQNHVPMPLGHFTEHLEGACSGINSQGIGAMWHSQSFQNTTQA